VKVPQLLKLLYFFITFIVVLVFIFLITLALHTHSSFRKWDVSSVVSQGWFMPWTSLQLLEQWISKA